MHTRCSWGAHQILTLASTVHFTMSRIALIELSSGHCECLFSQIRFLREAGHDVVLFVHPDLAPRLQTTAIPLEVLPITSSSLINAWQVIMALRRGWSKHGISRVVFNTASGSLFRKVALTMPFGLPTYAVVHDLHRLSNSWSQRVTLFRMKGLLVLADRLTARCQALTHIPTNFFYPAWFATPKPGPTPVKAAPDVWLVTIGQIETKRRNYTALIEAAEAGWPDNLHIRVIGDATGVDGEDVLKRLRESRMKHCIHISDGFMDDDHIHRLLPYCDGILPLTDGNKRYRNEAVSGAFNLAFGYHLPLISGIREQPSIAEIDDITLAPADHERLVDLLRKLAFDSTELQQKQTAMRQDPRWRFAASQKSYLRGIGLLQHDLRNGETSRFEELILAKISVGDKSPMA